MRNSKSIFGGALNVSAINLDRALNLLDNYDSTKSASMLAEDIHIKGKLPNIAYSTIERDVKNLIFKPLVHKDGRDYAQILNKLRDEAVIKHRTLETVYCTLYIESNELLFSYITEAMKPYFNRYPSFTKEDVVEYLDHKSQEVGEDVDSQKIARLAASILVTLSGFSYVHSHDKTIWKENVLNRYIDDDSLTVLIHLLKRSGCGDKYIVHNKLWLLFEMDGIKVIDRIKKLSDRFIIQSAGDIVKIECIKELKQALSYRPFS